jgi:hypothetical protein
MTLSTRTLTQTLAALAIAASTGSGVLYGATAAYAAHVDSGRALVHGHRTSAHTRTGAHTLRSHIRWQFPAHLWQVPSPLRCILCARHEPGER